MPCSFEDPRSSENLHPCDESKEGQRGPVICVSLEKLAEVCQRTLAPEYLNHIRSCCTYLFDTSKETGVGKHRTNLPVLPFYTSLFC